MNMRYKADQINFRTTTEYKEYLKQEAERLNLSIAALIERSVEHYLSGNEMGKSKGGAEFQSA